MKYMDIQPSTRPKGAIANAQELLDNIDDSSEWNEQAGVEAARIRAFIFEGQERFQSSTNSKEKRHIGALVSELNHYLKLLDDAGAPFISLEEEEEEEEVDDWVSPQKTIPQTQISIGRVIAAVVIGYIVLQVIANGSSKDITALPQPTIARTPETTKVVPKILANLRVTDTPKATFIEFSTDTPMPIKVIEKPTQESTLSPSNSQIIIADTSSVSVVDTIVDVKQIIGQPVQRVERLLGKANDIDTQSGSLPPGGQTRDYQFGKYLIFIDFDQNLRATGFSIVDGLKDDQIPIWSWQILLDRVNFKHMPYPDFIGVYNRRWNNYKGLDINIGTGDKYIVLLTIEVKPIE